MKTNNNNLQVARWNDDPTQRGECLSKLIPEIKSKSKSRARRYRVEFYQEDIESDTQLKLLQQMVEADPDGPFAKDSPQEAADFLLDGLRISNRLDLHARKEGKRQSRQAEIFEDLVPEPDVPPDMEKQLMDAVPMIQRIISLMPNFTASDRQSFLYDSLLITGVYDLPEPKFVQALKAAGVSIPDARAYKENYEKHGGLNSRNRKARSRAHLKIKEAFTTAAKLRPLLVFVLAFALPLALVLNSAIQQPRSVRQNDFVNRLNFGHQIAFAQQGSLIHRKVLSHQET
jgi:hypothetical protein